MTTAPEFSFEVDLDALPKAGRRFALEAGPAECEAVARRLGVIAVEHLSGALAVMATKDRFFVTGNVAARLKRECVATLEDMVEEIDEPFEIEFLRGVETPASEDEEISLDTPEFIEGPSVDLGEILVQQLSLAMDPFPRKPGGRSLAADFGAGEGVSPLGEALAEALKTTKNQ